MSNATNPPFVKDAWQMPRNARTLRAFMALRQAEIGARIAALRKDRGNPPQDVVAGKLGVSYRAYQAWEAGDTKPSYRNLEKLAAYYAVSVEYILLGQEEVPDVEPGQLDRIEAKLDALYDALLGGATQPDALERLQAAFETLRPAVEAAPRPAARKARRAQN